MVPPDALSRIARTTRLLNSTQMVSLPTGRSVLLRYARNLTSSCPEVMAFAPPREPTSDPLVAVMTSESTVDDAPVPMPVENRTSLLLLVKPETQSQENRPRV